jgi:hypothetical protein
MLPRCSSQWESGSPTRRASRVSVRVPKSALDARVLLRLARAVTCSTSQTDVARSGSEPAGNIPRPVASSRASRHASIRDAGELVYWRGAARRDGVRVVESATYGRNARKLGGADKIAPSGR